MSTQHATRAPGVVIDRHERDTLHREVGYIIPGDEMSLEDRGRAAEHRQLLEFAFGLLDEIGWSDDDPRSEFVITVERDLLRNVIAKHRDGLVSSLPDDHGEARSADIDALRVLNAILARLDAGEVTR